MKKLSVLLVVAFGLFTQVGFANFYPSSGANEDIRGSIMEMIGVVDIDFEDETELEANLRFMINGQNEIVLIDCGSQSENLNKFLKDRISFEKIDIEGVKYYQMYQMKITIKK